jgi:hypothetical protein
MPVHNDYVDFRKSHSFAYYTNGTSEILGYAIAGISTTAVGWSVVKIEYTGDNWITKYPIDATSGKASSNPKFIWSNVTTYSYGILGL